MRIITPAKANSSARETPVTISGFVSGMFVTAIVTRRIRPDMARMPIAAMVPRTVATTEAITAIMTEFASSGSSTPSRKRAPYCANVKPFHTAMSVIVFESARVKGKLWLFPVSILLHAVCDLPAALYQRQVIPMWAVYPIMAVITAGIVWLAVRSFGRTRELCGEKGA